MRAGKLDRVIVIERSTEQIDAAGVVKMVWTPLATLRAEIVTLSIEDKERAFGAATDSTFTFRTHWHNGVSLDDRVSYDGQHYTLQELVEIPRRRG